MSIEKFINKVLSEKNNKPETYSLGKLSESEIEMLKQQTGNDLTDFERVIDKFGVIHAIKEHGEKSKEEPRGQIAIEPKDFENIPEITASPDNIESGEKNRLGRELIKYTKEIENEITYVEEIREGKKILATQTMYKKKTHK